MIGWVGFAPILLVILGLGLRFPFLFSLGSGRSLAELGQPKVTGDRIGGDPSQNGGFVGTTEDFVELRGHKLGLS